MGYRSKEFDFKEILLSSATGYVTVNVTKNQLMGDVYENTSKGYVPCTANFGLKENASYTGLLNQIVKNDLLSDKEVFLNACSPETLLKNFDNGILRPETSCWVSIPGIGKYCLKLSFYLYTEEEDVVAFVVAEDYSNEMARAENKDRFIFDMSHDVRTPMNAIMGYTQMAKKYINEPKKALECLDKLELSGEQLLKIINDAFDLARIESGKVVLDEDEANIIDCLDRLLDMVKEQAKEKNIGILIDTEDVENVEAIFDEIKVGRIVYNIVSNAIKFTPNNGKVSISVTQNTDSSTPEGFTNYDVTISDNGVGMSRDFVDHHLFETFSGRHTTTLTGIKGVGLGMSIAKRLIELMNGKLLVDSEPGKGTKVTCRFCFRKIDYYKGENKSASHGSSIMGTRILLVEDNELNREIERDCLESEGIIVDEATNGKEALDKVEACEPGTYLCVLMDVMMPVMDGVEATLKIRSLKDTQKALIPIIAMTANAFGEDKERCLKAGMNGYLVKPIRNEKLLEVINELV